MAWLYAEKVVRYCAEKRISEVKKLSRTVKELRAHYINLLSKDLDREHREKIFNQADEFIKECAFDFQILYYSTCNEINHQHLKIEYDEMRTNAFLSMMFCREVRKHENRMTALIAQKLGQAREGHLPCIDELYTCMDAYLGNHEIKITPVIETAMMKFQKNLSKIEFTLV